MTTFERRSLTGDVQFRAEGDTGLIAYGYAAKFNVNSSNLGGFVERVAPGAFTKTLQEADIRALFNHDQSLLLGRNRAGTLRLQEDEVGLAYEIDLPDTSLGRDVATHLERGDLTGSSFGFRVIDDEWGETDSGFPMRTLKQVALRDVGPVVFPAYSDSESALRGLAESRSMDLQVLVAAANEDSLQNLLRTEGDVDEKRDEDSGRETPTVIRRKFAHLLQ